MSRTTKRCLEKTKPSGRSQKLLSCQDGIARGYFLLVVGSRVINECNDIDNILLLVCNVFNVMYGCFVKGV